MARARAAERAHFACTECGGHASKWLGRCPECGAWNTLVEVAAPARAPARAAHAAPGTSEPAILCAADVAVDPESHVATGIGELDRVLGGGLVAGSVVLIGGDPGIGKSTLLLQALARLAGRGAERPLYVTGEESLRQVVLRARRLGLAIEGLRLLAETRVERIVELAGAERPDALVIDSIQTMSSDLVQSAPGSVAQVRESAARLVRFAKTGGAALVIVGHVTKEGAIAGPRVLEHMVDTVLYFEGDAGQRHRVVRAVKNRFGAANEIGVFAMTESGLREVRNPSAIFLSRESEEAPGSVVTVAQEGTRALLVEIQALVDAGAAGSPRRVAVGLDAQRLALLLAVLHRHAGVATHDQDVYVNAVGGVRIGETAADLPTLVAVRSSLASRPVDPRLVVFGEVGLAGEVRPVPNGEERLRAAAKHGFARALVPRANRPRRAIPGLEVTPVASVGEALEAV